MKKAAIFFLCVFLLFSGSAFAEAIDLSSLSDNELLELYNEADKLLTERGVFEGEKITAGTYIVGEDIKAGQYRLKCIDVTDSSEDGTMFISVNAMKSNKDYDRECVVVARCAKGEEYTVRLSEGFYLFLNDGSCTIEAVQSSFAP